MRAGRPRRILIFNWSSGSPDRPSFAGSGRSFGLFGCVIESQAPDSVTVGGRAAPQHQLMAKFERCALFPGASVPGGDMSFVLNDGFSWRLRSVPVRENGLTFFGACCQEPPSGGRSPVCGGPTAKDSGSPRASGLNRDAAIASCWGTT